MVIAAPRKLRLHCGGQTIPIPVIIYGRVIIRDVIVRVSIVVLFGVPPIRKTKRNEVETEEETVVMTKEMVVPVVVKESAIRETMVTKIVTRSILMTESVSKRTVRSTSCGSSTTVTGHRSERARHRDGKCRCDHPRKESRRFHIQQMSGDRTGLPTRQVQLSSCYFSRSNRRGTRHAQFDRPTDIT